MTIKKHIALKGDKKGQWVKCPAKQKCLNGGMHITSDKLNAVRLWKNEGQKSYIPLYTLRKHDVEAFDALPAEKQEAAIAAEKKEQEAAEARRNTPEYKAKSEAASKKYHQRYGSRYTSSQYRASQAAKSRFPNSVPLKPKPLYSEKTQEGLIVTAQAAINFLNLPKDTPMPVLREKVKELNTLCEKYPGRKPEFIDITLKERALFMKSGNLGKAIRDQSVDLLNDSITDAKEQKPHGTTTKIRKAAAKSTADDLTTKLSESLDSTKKEEASPVKTPQEKKRFASWAKDFLGGFSVTEIH